MGKNINRPRTKTFSLEEGAIELKHNLTPFLKKHVKTKAPSEKNAQGRHGQQREDPPTSTHIGGELRARICPTNHGFGSKSDKTERHFVDVFSSPLLRQLQRRQPSF